MTIQEDIAGWEHWDTTWSTDTLPAPIVPDGRRIRDYTSRRLQRLYDSILDDCNVRPGATFLEVGCGGSVWMPHFAQRRGLIVSGLDYSTKGCDRARRILDRAHVKGELHQVDFFSPPSTLLATADVVFSNGVIEHFKDTAGCIAAIAAFLKPGGLMISSIPNMSGLPGHLQRWFDRSTYDIHVPITLPQFVRAHKDASLAPIRGEYVLFANSGVITMKQASAGVGLLAKRVALGLAARLSMALWMVDGPRGRLPVNAWTSPYILCVARKPERVAK